MTLRSSVTNCPDTVALSDIWTAPVTLNDSLTTNASDTDRLDPTSTGPPIDAVLSTVIGPAITMAPSRFVDPRTFTLDPNEATECTESNPVTQAAPADETVCRARQWPSLDSVPAKLTPLPTESEEPNRTKDLTLIELVTTEAPCNVRLLPPYTVLATLMALPTTADAVMERVDPAVSGAATLKGPTIVVDPATVSVEASLVDPITAQFEPSAVPPVTDRGAPITVDADREIAPGAIEIPAVLIVVGTRVPWTHKSDPTLTDPVVLIPADPVRTGPVTVRTEPTTILDVDNEPLTTAEVATEIPLPTRATADTLIPLPSLTKLRTLIELDDAIPPPTLRGPAIRRPDFAAISPSTTPAPATERESDMAADPSTLRLPCTDTESPKLANADTDSELLTTMGSVNSTSPVKIAGPATETEFSINAFDRAFIQSAVTVASSLRETVSPKRVSPATDSRKPIRTNPVTESELPTIAVPTIDGQPINPAVKRAATEQDDPARRTRLTESDPDTTAEPPSDGVEMESDFTTPVTVTEDPSFVNALTDSELLHRAAPVTDMAPTDRKEMVSVIETLAPTLHEFRIDSELPNTTESVTENPPMTAAD